MTDIIKTPPPIPPRPHDGHKGTFGRVLIVGGSEGMIGAPALAGTAALRSGAGLVQLAVPRSILTACLSITPELIGIGLGRSVGKDELLSSAAKADAIVIGPGMGRTSESMARLHRLIRLDKPVVVDADALNLLSDGKRWPGFFKADAVLTPHPGEMSRLAKLIDRSPEISSDDEARIDLASAAARAFGQVIVLKGHRTVVTDGTRKYLNATGDSSLSKAGTGDVLCGILATLLAQGMPRFDAACAAVHLHGRAGELAGQRLTPRSVLARDVCNALFEAFAEYEQRYSAG